MEKINQLFGQAIAFFPGRRDNDHLTKIVTITAATTLVLYSSYKKLTLQKGKKSKGIKEIPSPKGGYYPYFGHMLSLGKSPGKQVQKWHKEVGHIFKLQMGIQTWIMLDDPVLAHKIFVTHGAQTSNRPDSNFALNEYSLHGKGVAFVPASKNWQKARSADIYILNVSNSSQRLIVILHNLVLSVISPKNVDDTFVDIINRETTALAKRLIDASSVSKEGTDPFKHLHLNSMNIVFSTAFGKRYQGIDDPEFNELSDTINEQIYLGSLENDLSNFLPIFSIAYYFTGKHEYTKKFFATKRNPLFRNLMEEATEKKESNLVKSLEEYDLDEDDKLVLLCKVYLMVDILFILYRLMPISVKKGKERYVQKKIKFIHNVIPQPAIKIPSSAFARTYPYFVLYIALNTNTSSSTIIHITKFKLSTDNGLFIINCIEYYRVRNS